MEPYERVMSAIDHRQPDRAPIDYAATPEFHATLKRRLGIDDEELLLRRLGVDFRQVTERFVGPEDMAAARGVAATGKDWLGVVWKPVKYEFGTYNEIAYSPLATATTVREIKEYSWPNPDWFDFSHLPEQIARLNDKRRYAIMYFAGGAFETPWYMRGMTRFLMDLVECPDIAEAISHYAAQFYKKLAMRALDESGGRIDIVGSGGDIGTQRGMMLSPELWRRYIKPNSEQLIRPFKDMGLKTFYHSCGGLAPVIEDLIEMGLDVLDPVQPKAAGMDPEELKRRFGDRLTFHGAVDEQELLPHGSPRDVRREVERLIRVVGRDGGYIVCPAHAVQPDTPVENILALYETAKGGLE